jgi:hypothetical protein
VTPAEALAHAQARHAAALAEIARRQELSTDPAELATLDQHAAVLREHFPVLQHEHVSWVCPDHCPHHRAGPGSDR